MVNTWKFYIAHNSTIPPCPSTAPGGSHITYSLNSETIRNYGCFDVSKSDDAIMQDILQPGISPKWGSNIVYAAGDIVYLNDVLIGTPSNYIDLVIEPYSNYNPDSAIVALIEKLTDMAGLITNVFTKYGIIDYQYVSTEFFKQGTNVVLRINLLYVGA